MAISVFPAPSAASKTQKTVYITSTQNWTAPADVTKVDVWLAGGGGAGGGGAGAHGRGGGGSVTFAQLTVTPNTTYTITIGGGGGGVSNPYSYSTGNSGAASSFGSLLSIGGGAGGSAYQSNSGSAVLGGAPAGYGGHGGYVYYTGSVSMQGSGREGDISKNLGHGGAPSYVISYLNQSYATSQWWENTKKGGNSAGDMALQGNYTVWNGIQHAKANSGSGGAGASTDYAVSGQYTGNGGSGVCIIQYWSAL